VDFGPYQLLWLDPLENELEEELDDGLGDLELLEDQELGESLLEKLEPPKLGREAAAIAAAAIACSASRRRRSAS
jgi:hypothetical protein